MQGQDKLGNFEVYIPEEAEVKTIPLWTLPVSTLRRMGLHSLPCDSAKERSLPSATWISPVVIRERECSPTKCDTASTAKAKMTSLLTHERRSASGPYLMPFVTSNCTAFSVLGKFLPHSENLKQRLPGRTDPIPCGKPPHPYQDAVIIHHGRIYLSVKKTKSVRGPSDRPRSCFSSPAVSPLQATEINPVSPPLADAKSLESCPVPPGYNAAAEKTLLQRFGVTRQISVALTRVTQSVYYKERANNLSCFPTGSEEEMPPNTEQINDVADNNEQMDGTETVSNSELEDVSEDVSNNRQVDVTEDVPNKQVDVTEDVPNKQVDVIEDVSNSEQEDCIEDVSNSEQVNVIEDVPNSEQEDGIEDVSNKQVDITEDVSYSEQEDGIEDVSNKQVDITEDVSYSEQEEGIEDVSGSKPVGGSEDVSTGDSDESWMAEFPQMLSFTPTVGPRHTFDFEQSAREEAIDRIRAKLRESEAALNNLHPLK